MHGTKTRKLLKPNLKISKIPFREISQKKWLPNLLLQIWYYFVILSKKRSNSTKILSLNFATMIFIR
jgi:hypothetical protein